MSELQEVDRLISNGKLFIAFIGKASNGHNYLAIRAIQGSHQEKMTVFENQLVAWYDWIKKLEGKIIVKEDLEDEPGAKEEE